MKQFPQVEKLKGFSLVWTLVDLQVSLLGAAFPTSGATAGSLPVYRVMFLPPLNFLLQTRNPDRSPVGVLM